MPEILFQRDQANPKPAEGTAIEIATQQGSRSFGLRSALSLAKLYQWAGRSSDARGVLGSTLEGFAPSAEMPEIRQAAALLAPLRLHRCSSLPNLWITCNMEIVNRAWR
jgi:hypothetical protein